MLFDHAFRVLGAGFVAVIIDKNIGAGPSKTNGDGLPKSFTRAGNERFLTFQYSLKMCGRRFIGWRIGINEVTPSIF